MTEKVLTYLSLGSNKGHRAFYLQQAIFELQQTVGPVTAISGVYKNPAVGFKGEPFLNLCVSLETEISPSELLEAIRKIEVQLGRIRDRETTGYQSRKIDIDILYYGTEIIDSETLQIPHPRLAERLFVLKPLSDIAPQFYHPILEKDSRNLLQECRDTSTLTKAERGLFKSRQDLFSDMGFLAIEGNIGSGKTSLAQRMSKDFNAKLILERFAENPFLPKFYQAPARYAFPLEMSFLADRYQQYLEDTTQLNLFKSLMISDYDIYKSLIFAKITLQKEEYALYRKLFGLMYREVRKPKFYVFLHQNTERLLNQIAKRGRDYESGIDADYLEKINKGYAAFIKSSPELNTLVLDVNDLDFVANEADYQHILNQIIAHSLKGINT